MPLMTASATPQNICKELQEHTTLVGLQLAMQMLSYDKSKHTKGGASPASAAHPTKWCRR